MKNEQFWKKLDSITNKPQTIATTTELLKALAQGYSQRLEILILGVEQLDNPGVVNQACIISEGKKSMLYLTDKRHVKFCKTKSPAGSMYLLKCLSVCICDVINNALEKEEVAALVFNEGSKNMYTIPKFILELYFCDMTSFLRNGDEK